MLRIISITLALTGIFLNPVQSQSASDREILYVGTFTGADEDGIYIYSLDRSGPTLKLVQSVGGMESPTFLTVSPNGKYLYVANRNTVIPDKNWGSVSSYAIDPQSGKINHLNDQPAFGLGPCYISTDSQARFVFIANYYSGDIAVFPILLDGTLGTISDFIKHEGHSILRPRQDVPHAHCTIPTPDDRYLYVADLGLDKIKVYEIDYTGGKLIPRPESDADVIPGSGPRQITFHPNGKWSYVIEEISGSVSAFKINHMTGAPELFQHISSLPADFEGSNFSADLHTDAAGKWLWAANRGHDSLAFYSIDPENGNLTLNGFQPVLGKYPRNFLVDPEGQFIFVANRNTNNLVVFSIDPETGTLSKTGDEISVPQPVCIKMLQLK